MLYPVFVQAKETSRIRVCVSNLRQLGFAITRYMDDNNSYGLPRNPYRNPSTLNVIPLIPDYIPTQGIPFNNPNSRSNSYPYIGLSRSHQSKWLWSCPGDIDRGNDNSPYWWNYGSSYLYPADGVYVDEVTRWPRKLLTWRDHKRDLFLADFWFDFHNGYLVRHDFDNRHIVTPQWVMPLKGINILFLDLHVKTITARQREEYLGYARHNDNPYYVPTPKNP